MSAGLGAGVWSTAPISDPPLAFGRKHLEPLGRAVFVHPRGFVFASGVERDVIGWVIWGAVLLVVAVVCAWQWLWCLDLPLVLWALLSQNIATLLRLVQGHLIFRDFRWDPETEVGPLIVWQRMGIWFHHATSPEPTTADDVVDDGDFVVGVVVVGGGGRLVGGRRAAGSGR